MSCSRLICGAVAVRLARRRCRDGLRVGRGGGGHRAGRADGRARRDFDDLPSEADLGDVVAESRRDDARHDFASLRVRLRGSWVVCVLSDGHPHAGVIPSWFCAAGTSHPSRPHTSRAPRCRRARAFRSRPPRPSGRCGGSLKTSTRSSWDSPTAVGLWLLGVVLFVALFGEGEMFQGTPVESFTGSSPTGCALMPWVLKKIVGAAGGAWRRRWGSFSTVPTPLCSWYASLVMGRVLGLLRPRLRPHRRRRRGRASRGIVARFPSRCLFPSRRGSPRAGPTPARWTRDAPRICGVSL